MTTELDDVRSFRIEDASVSARSRDDARAALLAHIASQADLAPSERRRPARTSAWTRARRWRGGGVHTAATVASVAVVLLVGAIAFATHHRDRPNGADGVHSASQRQLLGLLGVLRQPQTGPARAFDQRGWPFIGTPAMNKQPGDMRPDRSLIRVAAVTPWGAKIFIVPLLPPTSPQLECLGGGFGETVALYVQGIGWSDFSTAADVEAAGAGGPSGAIPGTGGNEDALFEIVPDGVAKVVVYLAPVFPRPGQALKIVGSVTATVHHNVATFRLKPRAGASLEIWYAANGTVIRRSGGWDQFKRIDGHLILKAQKRQSLAERRRAIRQSAVLLSRRESSVRRCQRAHGLTR